MSVQGEKKKPTNQPKKQHHSSSKSSLAAPIWGTAAGRGKVSIPQLCKSLRIIFYLLVISRSSAFLWFAPHLGGMKDCDPEAQRSGKRGVCSSHPAHPWPCLQRDLSRKLPHHQSGADLGTLSTKPCLSYCFTSRLGSLSQALIGISPSPHNR